MVRVNPIEAGSVGNEFKHILDASHVSFEEVPNFLKVLANSTAGLKAYVESEEALLNGELTPRLREQIALTVAEINACNYSLVFHSVAGREAGLTDQEIELARRASALDPKADAALRFTQRIVLQRGKVSDADFRALREAGFSQAAVVEIIANISLNTFTNFLNLTALTESDFPPLEVDCKKRGEAIQDCNAAAGASFSAAPRSLKMVLPKKQIAHA